MLASPCANDAIVEMLVSHEGVMCQQIETIVERDGRAWVFKRTLLIDSACRIKKIVFDIEKKKKITGNGGQDDGLGFEPIVHKAQLLCAFLRLPPPPKPPPIPSSSHECARLHPCTCSRIRRRRMFSIGCEAAALREERLPSTATHAQTAGFREDNSLPLNRNAVSVERTILSQFVVILSLGRVESLHALIVSVRLSVRHNRKAFI